MKLIVGLGNPGLEYENTRHNIGFKAIDAIAHHLNVKLKTKKFHGLFYKGHNFILAKPLTYMNLSGDFVVKIMKYFQIPLDDILVIYDELDLVPGKLMLKAKGSSNGHKGIQDIIEKTSSAGFARLKIGIGRASGNNINYVLGQFSPLQLQKIAPLKQNIINVALKFIDNNWEQAVNELNKQHHNQESS